MNEREKEILALRALCEANYIDYKDITSVSIKIYSPKGNKSISLGSLYLHEAFLTNKVIVKDILDSEANIESISKKEEELEIPDQLSIL